MTPTSKAYYIQCTTWRDKKQVWFLSSNEVGYTKGLTVKRHSKKKKKQDNIVGPRAQRNHVTYLNTVGRNDHDSFFSSATIQTIHYYLRIFFWALDRVVHTLFVAVSYPTKSGINKSDWKKYLNRNSERHDFQIDLIISLINFAIALEWEDE